MAMEKARKVYGATATGEVVLITQDVADHDESGDQTKLRTREHYIVRQGGRTIIDTADKADAVRFAETLVKGRGIVAAGVDERPLSEVGSVAPHAHRIPTHELHVTEEPDKALGDEPARIEGTDVTTEADHTPKPERTARSRPSRAKAKDTEAPAAAHEPPTESSD